MKRINCQTLINLSLTATMLAMTGMAPSAFAQESGTNAVNTAVTTPATEPGGLDIPAVDPWRFDFDIIGWGPQVNGDIGVAGHQANVDVKLNTLLGDLNGIAMLGFQLRKEKFGFYAQPNWISLQANGSVGPLGAEDDMQVWVVDVAGFYQLAKWGEEKPLTLDALIGVRYWNVSDDLTLTLPGGAVIYQNSDSTYLIDPIIGLRSQIFFTRKLSLSLHADVGGFSASQHSSDLTWQALGTLDYDFTRHFSLALGYRALSTYQPEGKNLDLLMHGAFLALDFHW